MAKQGFRGVVIYDQARDVEARLLELGLTQRELRDALEAGLAAAALATANHPPNFGGTSLWAEAVRGLRETLIPKGWHRDNSYNFATVVRGDGKIAIAVAAGDAGTGDKDLHPSTSYKRGPIMIGKVEVNQHLPFDHLPVGYGDADPNTPEATWILLHYREHDKLRSELSLPVTINKKGFVETWGERIVLTPIDIDPARVRILDDEPVEPMIEIKRRA